MRRILLLAPAALLLAVGATAAAKAITIGEPLEASFRGGVDPKFLPAGERTPVSLHVRAGFKMRDGSHPPALQEIRLKVDKSLRPDLGEVPVCRARGGRIRGENPFRDCKDSIVGSGRMNVEILFPELSPIRQRSKIVAYKTSAKGRTATVALRTSITVPTPAEIISMMEIKPIDGGRYGIEAVATLPKIAGGSGSITNLALRFRRGIFTATCPRDRRLQVGLESRFADGTFLSGAFVRPCESRR